MSASAAAFIGALVDRYRQLAPLLRGHIEDNEGEVLPHLFLADAVRWLTAMLDTQPELCRSIIKWVEYSDKYGSDDVREVIAVSFVEMIPDPGQPGSALRDLLGPTLRAVDPWYP